MKDSKINNNSPGPFLSVLKNDKTRHGPFAVTYAIIIIFSFSVCLGCAKSNQKQPINDMAAEAVSYAEISVDELFYSPSKYDKQPIAVIGIYSGFRDMGPILYKNNAEFRASNPIRGIRILGHKPTYTNVRHGAPAVVRGIFMVPEENELKLFFARIIDVTSVTGVGNAEGVNPRFVDSSSEESFLGDRSKMKTFNRMKLR
jgi:hypothetical protein